MVKPFAVTALAIGYFVSLSSCLDTNLVLTFPYLVDNKFNSGYLVSFRKNMFFCETLSSIKVFCIGCTGPI